MIFQLCYLYDLNFIVKLQLFFFKPSSPLIGYIHIIDMFHMSCSSLHIWRVMFLAAITWDKSWMRWDTAIPMTSFTETSSPTACCLRARRTPPLSNSGGSVWPLRFLRVAWFLEVCLSLLRYLTSYLLSIVSKIVSFQSACEIFSCLAWLILYI